MAAGSEQSREGSGAVAASHLPSADTEVVLQRTAPMTTDVPLVNERWWERRTNGVDPKSVSAKGRALFRGIAMFSQTCVMASRITVGSTMSSSSEGLRAFLLRTTRCWSSRRLRPRVLAAERRAAEELILPGPKPPTDLEYPLLDTITTSSNDGQREPITEIPAEAEPMLEPSTPVRLHDTSAA